MSERLIELFEKERGWPSVINFSDYGDTQSLRYNFQYLRENLFPLKMAEKIVVFPDFSPTEEGKVPTGVAALIDTNRVPDYLSLVGGADIGCQMRLVRFDIDEAEFRKDVGLLDEVVASLRSRKDSVDLGGGNHFLDFLVFEDGQMGALVHTGSFGDQQVELGKLTKNPEKYWKKYHQVIASASENSQGIIDIVSKFYGKAKEIGSWVHNTVTVDNRTGLAIIRKGAIAVTDLNQRVIVPVSVGDGIIWAKPGANVGENTLWSMPHGGGRKMSRSEARKFTTEFYGDKISSGKLTDTSEFSDLVLPTSLGGLPVTELPLCYNSLQDTKDIIIRSGLIDPSSVQGLRIISCLNHLH